MDRVDDATATRRFGVFEVDFRSGELRKSGVRIRVQEQPLKVLEALLERPGGIVTREELRTRIWPQESFGDFDHAVNIAVAKLRTALGDSAETPRFIETLHGRGYRFIALADRPSKMAKIPHRRAIAVVVALVLGGMLVAAGIVLYSIFISTRPLPFQNFSITQITDTGKAELAAISSDGKYILHVQNDNGMESLWLRNIATGSNTQVIPSAPVIYRHLAFSPDGNYIYFQRASDGLGLGFDLYRAPVLGGTPQEIVPAVDTNISFSPDGRRMAYVRANSPELGKYWLLTADPDGRNETTLQISLVQNRAEPASVSWSPDGERIAYNVYEYGGENTSAIRIFDVTRKQAQAFVIAPERRTASYLQWMPDGHSLLALFADKGLDFFRGRIGLGVFSYPSGKFTPITRDANRYATLTTSADGRNLATVQIRTTYNIDLVSRQRDLYRSLGPARQEEDVRAFDWSSDSLVITNGARLARVSGGAETTLITDLSAAILQVTSCGDRYIVLAWAGHAGTGRLHLWRINWDGSDSKQLTSGTGEQNATCSPDGKQVYYFEPPLLKRVSIEGGKPEPVPGSRVPDSLGPVSSPIFARDGKDLFFVAALNAPNALSALMKVAAVSLQPGTKPIPRLLDVNPAIIGRFGIVGVGMRLAPDGRGLAYPITAHGVDNIWVQPLDGSPGHQITSFTSGQIADFRWSPTGKNLAVLHQHNTADVVLLRQSTD